MLDHIKEIVDINEEITNLQNTVCNYFQSECGTVVEEVSNSEYKETYENSPRGNSKKHCPNSNQIKEVNLKFDMFLI